MAQYEMNLRDYWRIISRRRLVILGSTVLVAVFSFWFAKQKVPTYQATAQVRYEQSTSVTGLLVEVLSFAPTNDPIETQLSVIRSFPVMEEAARRLGRLPSGSASAAMRESRTFAAVLDALAAQIQTKRVGGTNIIEITGTSTNSREARDIANTTAVVYREYAAQLRNARITEARQFIEQQLKEVEARVKRADEEIWAFREANRVISPGAESTVLLSLFTQLRGEIERTRQQRTELELAQSRLGRGATTGDERLLVEAANPTIIRLQGSLAEFRLERNMLELELTGRHPRLQAVDDRIRRVTGELKREVAAQVQLLRNREEILNRQIGELFQKNREVPAVELALQRLHREAKINDDLLTLLKTKHQEALIKEAERVDEVTIARLAPEPGDPVASEASSSLLAGALIGLILGLVLAFIRETLDTSIGTIEDVEGYLEVPVLGIIPHIDTRETIDRLIERRPELAELDSDALHRQALLITHFDPKSPVAEAFRTLRTNLQFARMDRQGKVFVVTSPTLQEGKTMAVINLALSMAQNGQRTLLVGGNMRRPSIYRFFGIEREPGLSDILVGNARWRDCIRTVADFLLGRFELEDVTAAPGLDNLDIIESGAIPPNPSELLSTQAMADFLRAVREQYDVVLIDTPPVLPVTDAAIVAGQVDGVILVYQAGKVGRLVLKRAKVHLESARAQVWGVVLNDVLAEVAGSSTYTHYYTHYYGEETGESATTGWRERVAAAVAALSRPRPDRAESDLAGQAPALSRRRSRQGHSGRRYRHLAAGAALLLILFATLAGVLSWRLGWLDLSAAGAIGAAYAPPVRSSSAAPRLPGPGVAGSTPMPRVDQSPRGVVVLGLTGVHRDRVPCRACGTRLGLHKPSRRG
jgi:Mrp family chromosome partitioning ATPase/uncharacterized protein involved in exopolysaccharide biosynthesis